MTPRAAPPPRQAATHHHRMASSPSPVCMQNFHPLLNQGTAARAVRSPPAMSVAAPPARSCLASMWREIQGAGDWAGLVDPLHPLLRGEIVRYGELVAACYKAFDLDPRSRRYLRCKHAKGRMLAGVGLGSAGYEVTKYVYATPGVRIGAGTGCGRWIGYVAVAADDEARRLGRRDVAVCLRGTVTKEEWAANLMSSLTPANFDPHAPRPEVKVESGFLSLYTSEDTTCRFGEGSCREQLLREVARLLGEHSGEELSVTVTGHSMGSALAVLLAYDLAELGLTRGAPVTVYSFGGPRVGNTSFKTRVEELGVKVLRVANVHDPVTKLPGLFFNESHAAAQPPWSGACYAHVGTELALDFFEVKNPAYVHDLEAYVRLLRCPRPKKEKIKEGREGRAGLLAMAGNWLCRRRLEDMAMQVGNLVQSLCLI